MISGFRIAPSGLMVPGRLVPASGLRVNWRHPLAAALQTCIVPDGSGGSIDLVGNSIGGGGASSVRPKGPATNGATTANATTTRANFTSGSYTFAAVGYCRNVVASSVMFRRYNYTNESTNAGWGLQTLDASNFRAVFLNNNASASYTLSSSGVTPAVGDWTLAATTDGVTRQLFVNGILNVSTGSGSLSCASSTSTLDMGTNDGAGNSYWEVYIGCGWSRVLTALEMRQFHFDPFCFLEPTTPTWYPLISSTAASGSVGQTLFKPTQALSGLIGPGGQVAQTLFKPTQALIGSTSVSNDEFFSWRTD